MQNLNIMSKFETIKPGDDVEIIVSCPLSGEALYRYYCSRQFLDSKSGTFQEWFKAVDFYKDYIEIGNNGFSGVSDLMLFYKNPNHDDFYSFYINCSMYENMLGMVTGTSNLRDAPKDPETRVPVILRILEYIDGEYSSNEYSFHECLKYLKIIN